jgi:hypothetical protein
MATKQSLPQSFIQQMAGTQSQAQSAVPVIPNNGNPNTVYNISPLPTPTWGTYVPTTTPGVGGASPSTSFDLVQAPYTPSSPGYVSPFTADPTVAMVLAGMPQAQGNSLINNMLNNLRNPRPPLTPNPGVPAGPGTPLPPTLPPPPGTAPGPGTRPPGSGPRPVGPISGPIDEWIRSPGVGRPPDPTAPTNLFDNQQGRQWALDWLRQNQGMFDSGTGSLRTDSNLAGGLQNLISNTTGRVREYFSNLFADLTGQNGWQAALGTGLGALGGATGNPLLAALGQLLGNAGNGTQEFTLSDETLANLNNMNDEQMNEALARIQETVEGIVIQPDEGDSNLEEWYGSRDQYSQQEWDNILESVAWNNFWNGSDQTRLPNNQNSGTRRPTLGLPAMDNVDVFLNEMNARNLAISEWFRNMRGRMQQ